MHFQDKVQMLSTGFVCPFMGKKQQVSNGADGMESRVSGLGLKSSVSGWGWRCWVFESLGVEEFPNNGKNQIWWEVVTHEEDQ